MKLTPRQREALSLVAEGRFYPTFVREEDGWHARWRGLGCENAWVDEYVRQAVVTPLTRNAETRAYATLHDAWMAALRSETGLVVWENSDCAAFAADLVRWQDSIDDVQQARAKIVFRLVPGRAREHPFSLVTEIPRGRSALRALGEAVVVWGGLREMRRRGASELAVELSVAEAENFKRKGGRDLLAAGYGLDAADLQVDIRASAECGEDAPSEDGRIDRTEMRLVVRVAGQPVTADEIRFLLDQGSSLVYFRDHWIEVDRNILKEALRALERNSRRKLTRAEALSFAFGLGHVGHLEIEELRLHGWLRGLVNALDGSGRAARAEQVASRAPAAIPGLTAELRPYQRRGVEWMRFLTAHGFGALLADDMGLGKTVQTIAWMLASRASFKPDAPRVFLVVAPLTLIQNWRHEIAKFAPTLAVYVHQGELRHLASGFARAVSAADVVLTSYTLLVRDYTCFSEVEWAGLVLDEAQTIKNADTQVARAASALTPRLRVALTGTPIENSVADVWSIENFLNPGFLGERTHFNETFVRPLAADGHATAAKRLNRALEPFVLRRLKTEREIAAELGVKTEIREYCELTPAQRSAYEEVLADFRNNPQRQGDVFAFITRLKLVCDGEGKLNRLCELLEQIFSAGESALVFTQYAKIGAWLQSELEKRFARRFPFLHGGLSAAQREDEIERFNAEGANAFILSLRAGGFGLNLVKATHVIHFDRWWNPAVENQATDRAHRIGQTKTVFVHPFITSGTLEEHVEELLERKRLVAGLVVTSGESFLSQLDAKELLEAASLDV